MPNPVTQDQTVQATNVALAQMDPPGAPIANLDTDALSDPGWSCNNFSPTVLEQVCALTGTNPNDLQTTDYPQGGNFRVRSRMRPSLTSRCWASRQR